MRAASKPGTEVNLLDSAHSMFDALSVDSGPLGSGNLVSFLNFSAFFLSFRLLNGQLILTPPISCLQSGLLPILK